MKIKRGRLQQIIREELTRVLSEEAGDGELDRDEAEKLKGLVGDAIADAQQDGEGADDYFAANPPKEGHPNPWGHKSVVLKKGDPVKLKHITFRGKEGELARGEIVDIKPPTEWHKAMSTGKSSGVNVAVKLTFLPEPERAQILGKVGDIIYPAIEGVWYDHEDGKEEEDRREILIPGTDRGYPRSGT